VSELPLEEQLYELYRRLRDESRAKWNRDLPFSELLFDRWERAQSLGFGEGTSIYHSSYVFGDVQVGRDTWIGPLTLLDGTGGLRIGDNCSISTGVQIYTHDTVKWAVSAGRAAYEHEPVEIGNYCYIGSQSVVAKGVTVGERTVVGACSFVNQSLPPRTIAVGTPCRPIGRVEVDDHGDVQLVIEKR
jgi:acetyltransferase-like isoleucine patch superfamily enzyme